MKFTHSLAFNAVPEWKDGYINYKKLTSLAYDAERHAAAAAAATAEGDERSARLSLAAASDAESAFKRTLESERHKCLDFFAEKEAELIASTRLLEERLAALESMTDSPPGHLLGPSSSSAPFPFPPLTTAAATAATAGLPPPPPRSPRSPSAAVAGNAMNNGGGSSSGSIDAAAAAAAEEQQQQQTSEVQPQSPIAALRAQRPAAAFDPMRSPLLARRSLNAAEQGAGGSGAGAGLALAQSSSLFHNTSPSGPAGGDNAAAGAYSSSAMALTRRARALLRLRLRSGEAKAEVSDLRLEAEELFVALAGLVSFVDINKTGFRKALKKHDKVAVVDGVPGLEVRPLSSSETAETIARAFDERCRTSALEEAMEAVVLSYAVLATGGELGAAAAELRGRLRDRLVIERGTVWQEMVSRERRTAAARVVGGERAGAGVGGLGLGVGGGPGGLRRSSLDFGRGGGGEGALSAGLNAGGSGHGGQAARKLLLGPAAASATGASSAAAAAASRSAASCFGSTTALAVAAASALFFALLASPLFPHAPEKRNCLALLAFVSALWTTEAIPLYATSMLVPALVIGLRVMVSPLPDPETGKRWRLSPKEAAPLVFSAMMSQVIMLLLGGFAMAAALSKHYVAKWAASAVLGRLGRSPASLLLASMGVAAFLSMWISNVAAPVLVYSLLAPVLRTLPPRGASRSGDHMSRALALGVALASNLGGMTSPISSPQNVFAIERMAHAAAASEGGGSGPGWLEWFAVALPVAGCGVVACWGALLLAYPAARSASVRSLARQAGAPAQRFTGVQVYVVAVCAATVALWCANASLEHELGGMGVTATLPLVAFFGTGVLSKDDFNSMLWTVVMLAQGGLALGAAVDSSGLLHSVASAAAGAAQAAGLSPWGTLAALCALVLAATTFVSHTVGAMVILPIVESIGAAMLPRPHAQLLVMGAALTCSGAMGLPVSGFPNMAAASLEAADGEAYLSPSDFIRVGVPCSVVAYLLIVTLGYRLMTSVNGW